MGSSWKDGGGHFSSGCVLWCRLLNLMPLFPKFLLQHLKTKTEHSCDTSILLFQNNLLHEIDCCSWWTKTITAKSNRIVYEIKVCIYKYWLYNQCDQMWQFFLPFWQFLEAFGDNFLTKFYKKKVLSFDVDISGFEK